MFSGNWFGKWGRKSHRARSHQPLAKGPRRKTARQNLSRSLRMEELEDRRVLATFIVNNLADIDANGNAIVGTLRQAVQLSNASANTTDTIVFADFLFTGLDGRGTPATIGLSGGDGGGSLVLTDEVRILGPGAGALTVAAAGGNFRVFETNIDADDEVRPVTIGGITITGGSLTGNDEDANRGAGIFNREALTLTEVIITNNSASQGGGGIFMPFGSLQLERSIISGNVGGGGGGGILMFGDGDEMRPNVTISNSTLYGNSTFGLPERPGWGGAVFNRDGTLTVQNSTITQNSASAGGSGVATYGVGDPAEDPLIRTTLSHNILYGNAGSDLAAVRTTFEGDPIIPTLNIGSLDGAGAGAGYNFIGTVDNAVLRGDPNNPTDPLNPADPARHHFYEVVQAAEGIDWFTANNSASVGVANSLIHLASISGQSDQMEFDAENDFIFSVIDQPQYWREFVPDQPSMAPTPPQNIGPWIGLLQADFSGGAMDGWVWVSTRPDPADPLAIIDEFDFDAWAAGQPDDAALVTDPAMPPTNPFESRGNFQTPDSTLREATWGDLPAEPDDAQAPVAYVIEWEQGTNFYGLDPLLAALDDYGGSTPVFHPGAGSPVIDAGIGGVGQFDQRGRHFARVAGPAIDIGAVEAQNGVFRVDTLADETDGQYSGVWQRLDPFLPIFTFPGYETGGPLGGDFSLREALEFSEKNPGFDTILFEPVYDPDILLDLDDPTASFQPTIQLTLTDLADADSALLIQSGVNIIGPAGFELEIDASGNDITPGTNDAGGSRIFNVDDGDLFSTIDVAISNLTLRGGDVVDYGGAILSSENLTITSSTIKLNHASTNGGGVFSRFGDLLIDSTTLHDNAAANAGGGLFVQNGVPGTPTTATVRNSTISGNLAGARGGGIYNYDGEVLVEFSTITDNNAASFQASGIGSANGLGNTLTQVHSSIVSANIGGDIDFVLGAPTIQSLGFNLIGTGTAAVVFNQPGDMRGVTDPKLGPLRVEGGLNPTHRLLPGSPAIDTGDSVAVAGVAGVPLFDQRGSHFTRVFDGLQDTKDRIDIGAYELQPTIFIVDTLIDENDGDTSPGNFSLREAIAAANLNPLTDTIMFSPGLLGGEIIQSAKNTPLLQPGTPTDIRITDSVNIVGLGRTFLTLRGGARTDVNLVPLPGEDVQISRFFTIDDGNSANDIDVKITDLRLRQGRFVTNVGGSIMSHESLTLERVSLVDNSTLGNGFHGGAIYQRFGDLTLNTVTLTANTTNGFDADGGAVYVRDADLTVTTNSIISGNSTTQAFGSGGGIYIRNGDLTLTNSSVTNNLAPGGEADGGGIFAYQANLDLTGAIISFNEMTGSNSEGAGIHAKNSTLSMVDSVVGRNRTTGTQSEGAGIYLNNSSATIDDTTISSNTSSGNFSTGAAIAVVGGDLLIKGSTVTTNSTTGIGASGGAVHNLGGSVTILDSTVDTNSVTGAGAKGGGVFSDTNLAGATTLIRNSTISGNSTNDRGGGVYNADGLTRIEYSTITNNQHTPLVFGAGGGVGSFGSAATRTEVRSSIIAGNRASDVDMVNGSFANSFDSQGYNVIGVGLAVSEFNAVGDQSLVTNPMLGPLTLNGGDTLTHAPLEGSAAVNAGNPAAVAGVGNVPVNDQRGQFNVNQGFPRVLGGRIDVGAVESQFSAALNADFDNDGRVGGSDFLLMQRNFGVTGAGGVAGDTDGDGDVDAVDFDNFEAAFGTGINSSAAGAAAATAPPEDDGDEVSFAEAAEFEAPQAAVAAPSTEPATQSNSTRNDRGRILAGQFGLRNIQPDGTQRRVARRAVDNDANTTARDALLDRFADRRSLDDLALEDLGRRRSVDADISVDRHHGHDAGEHRDHSIEDAVFDLIGS